MKGMTLADVQAHNAKVKNWREWPNLHDEPKKPGRKPRIDKGGPFAYEAAKVVSGVLSVSLPLKLVSIANAGEHYRERKRRVDAEHDLVTQAIKRSDLPRLPVSVTITRVGPRRFDDDNNTISAKGVRDAIAKLYGWDDGDECFQWTVNQEKGNYAVRVEIRPR